MPKPIKQQAPALRTIPLLPQESLYVGIDVGKARHVAGFVSTTLLQRHERFEACPALAFENSREGFRLLLERLRALAPLEQCFVVLERTGHYHRALQQYLQELDLPVYVLHVQKRPAGLLKTDKRDALSLANHLYNQLERGIQVADKLQLVRRAIPPTAAAAQLKGLIRHRHELVRESTERRNKLTALCDELFPELVQVCKDPNALAALALRERFPTPQALATATLAELQAVREGRHPSNADLLALQRLAADTIGTKDLVRQRGLVLEQTQLIRELRLLRQHIDQLEAEIGTIVQEAREGQILLSIPGIGPVVAATIIASIGSIHNFPSAATLKAYFGWAPAVTQSGTTLDRATLTPGGTRIMKQMMFLSATKAIQQSGGVWAQLYGRLVKAKCPYDERLGRYTGKKKVLGRVAGQMIQVIYALLKRDAELVARVPKGHQLPPPQLYDPEVHQRHCHGDYTPMKSAAAQPTITLLPPSSR